MRPFSSIRIAAEVQYPEFLRQAQLWYTQCDPPRRCINTARMPPPFATSPCLKLQRRQLNSVLRVGSVFWTSFSDGDFPKRPFFLVMVLKKDSQIQWFWKIWLNKNTHWVPIYFEPPMMMVAGCLVSITRYVAGSSGCLVLSGWFQLFCSYDSVQSANALCFNVVLLFHLCGNNYGY